MNQQLTDYLNQQSDEELIEIVNELQQPTLPHDSKVRELSKYCESTIYHLSIIEIGATLLPIITERLETRNDKIKSSKHYIERLQDRLI